MTGTVEQGIRPVTLLMDDASPVAIVVEPRRARLAGEALDATKGSVLSYDVGQLNFDAKAHNVPES